jgi:hypothetical protein
MNSVQGDEFAAEPGQVDGIRILMGDEVSRRTKKAFEEGLARVAGRLDQSIGFSQTDAVTARQLASR